MPQILLVVGMTGLGWMLPEFILCFSTRKIIFSPMINTITAVSMGCVGYYIAFS